MLRRFYIAMTLTLVWAVSQAGDDPPTPQQQEAAAALSAHRFDELDQRYGAIQQQYEDRKISDEDLRAAFRAFYLTDERLAPAYEAWVQHSPKSYAAHLAKGIYYKKTGQDRRGDGFIADTSEAQLAGMDAAFEIADRELTRSLALTKKPLLTYLHLMDIRNQNGDAVATRKLMDAAIAVDPDNFVVREKYMGTLTTRWGGSVTDMRLFLLECQSSSLSTAHLKQLEGLVVEDEAWVHRYREGDVQTAAQEYRRAAELSPEHSCDSCGPLMQAADMLSGAGNYAEAIKNYSEVLRQHPDTVRALGARGFCELQLKQNAQAVRDLEQAAKLNYAYAQVLLAQVYLVGDAAMPDRDRAIELLEKAAAQNDAEAIKLLPIAKNRNVQMLRAPGSPAL